MAASRDAFVLRSNNCAPVLSNRFRRFKDFVQLRILLRLHHRNALRSDDAYIISM